ncbi:MAG: GMC family oxidoreductase N-terminal domain-containing protein [Thermoleophilaceae bacterium]
MRDAIIVGAGGCGAVVAKELAAHGLDVLVLEAGGRHLHPEKQWRHFENDANNPVSGYFRWGPSDRSKSPWARETPQNSMILQVGGAGGTTKHYYANSPRAYPGVFRGYDGPDRRAYDGAHRFPFGYRELIPYYEWVEVTLPVQTAAMGVKEERFLHASAKLGLPLQTTKDTLRAGYRPQENAILQPKGTAGRTNDAHRARYPHARGCTFCGYCVQGCFEPRGAPRNLAAKRSTDNSYLPMALTADAWSKGGRPVELIVDAFVTGIGTATEDGNTVARSVTWRNTRSGETATEQARVVVLSAGAIENPRLWQNAGLPNPNDWVGRGYTDHYFEWLTGVMPYRTGSSKGPGSGARLDFPGRGALMNVGLPPALQAFSSTMSDAGIDDVYLNGHRKMPGLAGNGRRVGNPLKSLLSDIDHLMNVFVMTDDDVEAQNRVSQSTGLPPDEHGPVPKVEVHFRERTARTVRNREFLVRRAVDLLKRAGARHVYRFNWPAVGLHLHSTMRMGTSASNSVLDANAEARFVKRLFVADTSALANSLGGPNPTLTAQALATRTAEKIIVHYFGGDPYVRTAAPVRSTDAKVTRAVVRRHL